MPPPRVRAVVLDASAINDLDSSAEAALHQLAADYGERGIELRLARIKGPVMDVLTRSGFARQTGAGALRRVRRRSRRVPRRPTNRTAGGVNQPAPEKPEAGRTYSRIAIDGAASGGRAPR